MSRHQEIVKSILSSKAVDFDAIGQVVSQMGPSLAVMEEPGDAFCGTMRHFVRLYWLTGINSPLENPAALGNVAGELRGGGA